MRRGWDREKYGGSREVRGGHELGEGGSRKRPGETRSGVRTERGGGDRRGTPRGTVGEERKRIGVRRIWERDGEWKRRLGQEGDGTTVWDGVRMGSGMG